jgi:hypothetical protein
MLQPNKELNTLVIEAAHKADLGIRIDGKLMNDDYVNVTGSFPALVRFAELIRPQWHVPTDKWPEEGSYVLCEYEHGVYYVAYLMFDDDGIEQVERWRDTDAEEVTRPLRWMEIPK